MDRRFLWGVLIGALLYFAYIHYVKGVSPMHAKPGSNAALQQ